MTQFETQLWNRLESFSLDEKDARLTFSQRLARENGWNRNYTLRVIDEYKKFLFLCCISPHPVTPSDPVDQAWHQHLTYTKSYWNDLCKNTLEREIHHTPTKGGKNEQQKFDNLYTGLQQIYTEKFGTAPPPDIWHDNQTRFNEINFQRVNLSRHWLIKKPQFNFSSLFSQLAAIASGIVFIQASGDGAFTVIFIIAIIIAAISNSTKGGKGGKGNGSANGCSSWSCTTDSGSASHHGSDSGCASSGCSGCSGCGGGCGGGD